MFILSIIVIIFLIDYIIKSYIVKNYDENFNKPFMKGHILLRFHKNKGAMMNIGEKHPSAVLFFSLFTAVLFIVTIIPELCKKNSYFIQTAFAFIMGGGISNTCDRIFRRYVVDYFSFNIKKIKHIVFNLGDIFIFIGAAMLGACYVFKSIIHIK